VVHGTKDLVSGLLHLIGALLAVAGLLWLIAEAGVHGTVWHLVSFAVYGASLILLYTASALYHLLPLSPRGNLWLRRIDHMMIFVLIAGTYTPFCLVPLRGAWGWTLLAIVWGLAIGGIVLKAVWMGAPRWLSVAFYLGMGWVVIVAVAPLVRTLPPGALAWIAAGGLAYTVGAVFYALKWPNLAPRYFGFHEVWHLFVLGGSFSHYWAILRYVTHLP
jgi:hemolysin III